ncbi:hypothetical protein [Arthrobacter sp. D5-1]|uniref:hypothetical protein n=1 Tax=Arthrobacter sp. D5-1 TaxID=1477518 RepID=UPI001A986AE6|nr:hypothetical protein [Arthrobacter sp. D5-1]QSZ47246.1 hypothetical protein AYX22_01645 [Arthrobacter sp. D5-1]
MVKQPTELTLNSHWAYRAKKDAELQEVRVLKLGVKHPKRAYIAFVDIEEEGDEAWVPIGRLKCRWEDLARFQETEAKWEAVACASAHASDVDAEVAELIFGCFDKTNSVNYWAGNYAGVTAVSDPEAFQKIHSIRWEEFLDSLCFEDDGELVLSLEASMELARRLAMNDPSKVQLELAKVLDEAREEHLELASLLRLGDKRWTTSGSSTRPRIEDLTEAAALIEDWIGADAVQEWNEIQALRSEIIRLSSIISKASGVLHAHGHTRDAASIRRLHGLTNYPVPRLKSYQEMAQDMKGIM